MLASYERRGWLAQVKKNGTCTVIFAHGDEVTFKTRHDDDHRMWTPKQHHVEAFRNSGGWDVYVAELLHSKTRGTKDTLYVFDVIVRDSEHLVGTTLTERLKILHARFPGEREPGQFRVGPGVTVTSEFHENFRSTWDSLGEEDEGLVLKDPNARLTPCFRPTSNGSWQVKCRKSTKNYSF